jgi:tRNA threonylcarbamoyl adenosine modification protein YeaZ
VRALRLARAAQGQPALLPPMAHDALAQAAIAPTRLDAVAVTVGPGSFTGLRAALALAAGFAAAAGVPVLGVTVAEALRAAPNGDGRPLWVALDSRRGHVFLATGEDFAACDPRVPPAPDGPVAVAGDAAPAVAASLLARGDDARLCDLRAADAALAAAAAAARRRAGLPDRPAVPLYVDPPALRTA